MPKLRLFLSITALSLGFVVVGVSLISANQVMSSEGLGATQLKFYLDKEILPDHILYSVLMGVDRVRLEASDPIERVYMQSKYAQRRFGYARELVKRKNISLALTTLTKSQKYLNQAAHDAIIYDLPQKDKNFVKRVMEQNMSDVKNLMSNFADQDKSIIESLLNEGVVLCDHLK